MANSYAIWFDDYVSERGKHVNLSDNQLGTHVLSINTCNCLYLAITFLILGVLTPNLHCYNQHETAVATA